MGKIGEVFKKYPVAISALVTVGAIWAYHNGYMNSICTKPYKGVTQA